MPPRKAAGISQSPLGQDKFASASEILVYAEALESVGSATDLELDTMADELDMLLVQTFSSWRDRFTSRTKVRQVTKPLREAASSYYSLSKSASKFRVTFLGEFSMFMEKEIDLNPPPVHYTSPLEKIELNRASDIVKYADTLRMQARAEQGAVLAAASSIYGVLIAAARDSEGQTHKETRSKARKVVIPLLRASDCLHAASVSGVKCKAVFQREFGGGASGTTVRGNTTKTSNGFSWK